MHFDFLFFNFHRMLSANLLPPEQKIILAYERADRVIRFFAIALVLFFIVHTILILPAFLPQYSIKDELARSYALEKAAFQKIRARETEEKIQTFSRTLEDINTHIAESDKASALLAMFFRFAETGVALSTLDIKNDGIVFISGTASTRRNLLAFEKEMRESERFLEISSPLSNIVEETNAQFTIRGTLKEQHRL